MNVWYVLLPQVHVVSVLGSQNAAPAKWVKGVYELIWSVLMAVISMFCRLVIFKGLAPTQTTAARRVNTSMFLGDTLRRTETGLNAEW